MIERDFQVAPRGLRLRLCEWGTPGAEPPVVILHGFLEQGAAWERVAEQLPGRYIIAPDQRGHGLSEHIGAGGFYHFWDYVSDLDALVTSLGGTVDLVGHSMGGTVATYFAGARSDAVRRLVIVEGLGPPDMTAAALKRSRDFLEHLRKPRTHRRLEDLSAAVARMRYWITTLASEVAERLAERITEPHPEGGLRWTWDPLHRATAPVPFSAELFQQWIRAITAPTLLVEGSASLFRVPDGAERAASLTDARSVTIDGAGHLIHHDRPEALARVIREHLSQG